MGRRWWAVAAALLLVAFALPARAADSWSTPHPGMQRLDRTTGDPLRVHALVVDLCQPGVTLRATASDERARTTSSFGDLVAAEAAINGGAYTFLTYYPAGLAMGAGGVWAGSEDTTWQALVAFGPSQAVFSPDAELYTPGPGISEVVSGFAQIVRDGAAEVTYDCSGDFCQRHPRTAVGLSRDRRTLYLLVVDGRSLASRGVTLAELAGIMAELGAWDAVNLDGGGASTMWVRGAGVVNDPSDGSERRVANHLAVQADGAGQPVCPAWDEEQARLDAARFDAAGSTDVDGDGLGDVCARGPEGLSCALSGAAQLGTLFDGPLSALSDALGWDAPAYYGTIHPGDVDGDGRADVCARGPEGVRCWRSTGAGFSAEAISGPAWSDADGWDQPRYYATIRLADVDGDGRADLCGRGRLGVECWRSTGAGFTAEGGPALSDAAGWGAPQRYGTFRTGDVDGDGRHDLCALGEDGVRCWLSDGVTWALAVAGPAWGSAAGLSDARYWGTFALADVTGDGRDDVCIRDPAGVVCAASLGTAFGAPFAGPALADADGWGDPSNALTLRYGDVTGDGRADVCARADAGVRCWPSQGAAFGAPFEGPALSDAAGWFAARWYQTLRLADGDGDGRADLCARTGDGVRCWLSDGGGFPTEWTGPAWSDAAGWDAAPYGSTFHVAAPVDRCAGPGGCPPGAVEEAACGECGRSWRACEGRCRWSAWSECQGVPGTGLCDDGNPCTDEDCITDSATCWTAPNTLPCDDGDACTNGDACAAGVCAGSDASAVDCDDGNPCTDDGCDPTSGCWSVPAIGPCDDGDACTVETCVAGQCVDILPGGVACDDGDPCTDDGCDPASGCWSRPNARPCDDGDACTTGDVCAAGVCAGVDTAAVRCDDGNPCTDDACDRVAGCRHGPNLAPCDDGDACTTGDACLAGVCRGVDTSLVDCADGNPCTADRCDSVRGCAYEPAPGPCDDGDPCTAGDACAGGVCRGVATAALCDDGDPCSADGCTPGVGCWHRPAEGPCDDGDACTTADRCVAGVCRGADTAATTCDDGRACTLDTCDPATGCAHAPREGDCDDGDPCTVDDACQEGACAGGRTRPCDDGDPCTDDACDPATGACAFAPRAGAGACDDGDACTVGDACAGGVCAPGAPKVCDDGEPCTADTCDPVTGDCVFRAQAGSCDDGDPCTQGDVCQDGGCQPGAPRVCQDGDPCTDDGCDPESGGCVFSPNEAPCDDGDPCTQGDRCGGGVCGGEPVADCADPCRACESAADCGPAEECTPAGDASYCTPDCTDDPARCAAGATCTPVEGGRRCLPDPGTCALPPGPDVVVPPADVAPPPEDLGPFGGPTFASGGGGCAAGGPLPGAGAGPWALLALLVPLLLLVTPGTTPRSAGSAAPSGRPGGDPGR